MVNAKDGFSSLKLPPLPIGAMKLLALLGTEDFAMRDFAEVAAEDEELSRLLIKTANSSLYGASQKRDDLTQAVVFVGLRTALSISLGFSLFRGIRSDRASLEERWCWRRLLISAVSARGIAHRTKLVPAEQAFLAGMVQEFGLLLWVQQQPRLSRRLLIDYEKMRLPLADVEQGTLSETHAAITESLLQSWKFPADVAETIGRRHQSSPPFGERPPLERVILAAEGVCDFVLSASHETYQVVSRRLASFPAEAALDIHRMLTATQIGVLGLADVLNVRIPNGMPVAGLVDRFKDPPAAD